MNPKSRRNDWLQAFLQWAEEPCPEGEWVYRGQAAAYNQILPSGLRESYRQVFRSGLYDVDYDLAAEVFHTSPFFQGVPLYPHIIDDQLGKNMQNMAYSFLGGPPSSDPRLSYPEVIGAVAQHYGYATLFIDVSLNPIVAALFASNRWTDRGYVVRDNGESVVYRWPAQRRSQSRLEIRGIGKDSVTTNVIDISQISQQMRRPHNQRAALATPVSHTKPVHQPFNSPLSGLELDDMAEFPSCETFRIPIGGGRELNQLDGVSMGALFPDALDLGYSYISTIALLSMLLPRQIDNQHLPPNELEENIKCHYLAIASAILDRECLRNVPHLPVPKNLTHMSAEEARRNLATLGETGRAAIAMMGTDEIRTKVEPALKRRLEDIQSVADLRHSAWVEALGNALGPERAAAEKALRPEYSIELPEPPEWVRGEFDARMKRVESILETAEFVPVFALERPEKFRAHIDSLPSSKDYEEKVSDQLAAERRWLECDFYDGRPNS